MIPFNKPFLAGNELRYIREAVASGRISGNGEFTRRCHTLFEEQFGFLKVLLTNSCTDALEMAAILCDIKPGDEVIVPSYTFVSAANAFAMQGATIVFADARSDQPNMDVSLLPDLINHKTKAIVVAHYGGISTDMLPVLAVAAEQGLMIVEDAAACIGARYGGLPLGSIGHFGAFSFHETKNINSGEGGMLVINDERFIRRAEIIWEKGTNRVAFQRGEVGHYEWLDKGSSFLPSELTAAFLLAQAEQLEIIQEQRGKLWDLYYELLYPSAEKGWFSLPNIPDYARHNHHVFPIICSSMTERTSLIEYLEKKGIMAVPHYRALQRSPYALASYKQGVTAKQAIRYEECLLRLPLFHELTGENVKVISEAVNSFYHQ